MLEEILVYIKFGLLVLLEIAFSSCVIGDINVKGRFAKSSPTITFYVIFGATQKFPKGFGDMRGKYWEFQLPQFPYEYDIHYLSDGPLTVNGIKCEVLPEGATSYSDRGVCIRTLQSMKNFVQKHNDTKWYYRGCHDAFVNVTALQHLLEDLEKKFDPMKEISLSYGVHAYRGELYPQGGTGWIFSNYAINQFMLYEEDFMKKCLVYNDDVAFTHFWREHWNISVEQFESNKFISTWPWGQMDVITDKKYSSIGMCPKYYTLPPCQSRLIPGPVREAVSIHMHKVPMQNAWEQLKNSPDNFSALYHNRDIPVFCQNPS